MSTLKKGLIMFLFMGMFSLVVLPLFLVVSARMIYKGAGDTVGRKIGAIILYGCALATMLTGVALIYTAIKNT
jgi:hypothetical protein